MSQNYHMKGVNLRMCLETPFPRSVHRSRILLQRFEVVERGYSVKETRHAVRDKIEISTTTIFPIFELRSLLKSPTLKQKEILISLLNLLFQKRCYNLDKRKVIFINRN